MCPHLEHGRERESVCVCACVAILTMINRICTRSRGLACRGSMFPLRVFILTIMQEMPSLRKVFLKRQHQRTADCIEHMGKNPIFACARAGVEGNQIVFSDMAREHEFLDMALAADLFLDTPPCNAHTTATYSRGPPVPCACLVFGLVAITMIQDICMCATHGAQVCRILFSNPGDFGSKRWCTRPCMADACTCATPMYEAVQAVLVAWSLSCVQACMQSAVLQKTLFHRCVRALFRPSRHDHRAFSPLTH